jgi:hypothetical protein
MGAKKNKPVTLLETSDERVELVRLKSGYTFRVVGSDGDVEVGVENAAITADEWCQVAIQLLLKCPDARDPIGLVSTTCDDLVVTGKTLGRQRKWTASLSDVGNNFNGFSLLEWSTSRPLDLIEIGGVFKAIIKRLDQIKKEQGG